MENLSSLNVGDNFDLEVLVEKASVANTKSGKPYLRVTVRTSNSSLDGVLWNFNTELQVKPGIVARISGKVDAYNGAKQLNLDGINLNTNTKPDAFARWTHMSVEEIWGDLVAKVGQFTEPLTKYVTEELLLNQAAMVEAFKKAPAARSVHNNWYGGLLEHVWSLCQLADFVVPHYQKNYLQEISKDKVMFGLMVHDAGKVIEYDYRDPTFKFTAIGHFTNHMVLGPAWVYEQANKWWNTATAGGPLTSDGTITLIDYPNKNLMSHEKFKLERAHLMHVLAAHHGQIIWGSPVAPASIEAIIVHHLDNLDAKVLHAYDFVKNKPGDVEGFSEQSYIEKARFYNYKV